MCEFLRPEILLSTCPSPACCRFLSLHPPSPPPDLLFACLPGTFSISIMTSRLLLILSFIVPFLLPYGHCLFYFGYFLPLFAVVFNKPFPSPNFRFQDASPPRPSSQLGCQRAKAPVFNGSLLQAALLPCSLPPSFSPVPLAGPKDSYRLPLHSSSFTLSRGFLKRISPSFQPMTSPFNSPNE